MTFYVFPRAQNRKSVTSRNVRNLGGIFLEIFQSVGTFSEILTNQNSLFWRFPEDLPEILEAAANQKPEVLESSEKVLRISGFGLISEEFP